ncbi:hypothetical protein INT48_004609 [Thamnidium elegans]|uniref:Uncharacterized protein n=1 Tax=Thamnidium elegans TaxID=101142 RepID=A0A8H7SZ56_9FUNG|nr:hypothetical protein INT48_004609 [Thamnidium elegans]
MTAPQLKLTMVNLYGYQTGNNFDSQERNPEDEYVSEVDEENLNDPEAPDSITWTDSAIRILLRIVSKNDAEAPNSRIPSGMTLSFSLKLTLSYKTWILSFKNVSMERKV